MSGLAFVLFGLFLLVVVPALLDYLTDFLLPMIVSKGVLLWFHLIMT